MKVFLTGASGYVGSYVLRALLERGHSVRCLVHARRIESDDPRVESVEGSILESTGLSGRLSGCEAVIHLVGILEEQSARGITFDAVHDRGALHVVQEALRAGISRFVHMSANGARPDGPARYQRSKWAGETHVRRAGFEHWTIFRPSILFGDPGPGRPEFATDLAKRLIRRFPILPIFGAGTYRMQPVHATLVAAAMAQAIDSSRAHGQSYGVGGLETLTYVKIVDRITKGMGLSPKPKIHVPLWVARSAVHTLGRVGALPITPDQFEMLVEGNIVDVDPFYRDFDVLPVHFSAENLAYVQKYV